MHSQSVSLSCTVTWHRVLYTLCIHMYTETCTLFHDTSQIIDFGFSGLTAGRGNCDCTAELCKCTCECNQAPMSGRPYSGSGCQCDPDNCYNKDHPHVSMFVLRY